MTVEVNKFRSLGGALCLNFINTRSWNRHGSLSDYLTSYTELIQWNVQFGLLSSNKADQLTAYAQQQPTRVQAVWDQAIMLRETIYGIFSAVVSAQAVPTP